ncbi:MAG: DUF4331 family protein [Actinomycetota bacterium]
MKRVFWSALAAFGLIAAIAAAVNPVDAADHLDAPNVQLDGRVDINDVYVFQSPENPDNTVLMMTVNPAAGVLSPTTFDRRASYRFQIDTNGNGRRNRTITVRFGQENSDGSQTVTVFGPRGRSRGVTGEGMDLRGGGRAIVGTFDDPFFFDFQAFQDQVKGAGGDRVFCDNHATDFFAGLNVSAIVLEVPSDLITARNSTEIGVWAETIRRGKVDRMGRPAIATVLVDDGSEDRFNRTMPHQDRARFGDQVRDNLLFLSGLDGSGYTEDEAESISDVLLPDILTFDTASSDGFLNGRQLADDVIDTALFIVTGGLGENGSAVLDGDCVDGNDQPFSQTFPYLAPAN